MAVVLLGVTWPLWWGGSEFPAIPVAAWLSRAPLLLDRLGSLVLLFGLAVLIFGSRRASRWGWSCVLISGVLLAALDQHRWQPWFYQLLLFAAIYRLGSQPQLARWLTWLTISIYFYSALGKLDAEFLHTVGQQFWQGLTELLGHARPPHEPWREQPIALIAALPIAEFLLAAGLAWPTTRRVAGTLAIAFHVALMLLLGPLGLDHSAGVICWNLQFAGQALCLFVLYSKQVEIKSSSAAVEAAGQSWGNRLAGTIAILAMALPLGERLGLWDHWTSWALYAPHSSRTEVWLASTAVDLLPNSLQAIIAAQQQATAMQKLRDWNGIELLDTDELTALWLRVPIERWSLEETGAPIYPQARFQLGVARALAAGIHSEFKIKAIVRSASARWDGRRHSREYQGPTGLTSAAQSFWLGTTPRH